jgi:hypothetical protein
MVRCTIRALRALIKFLEHDPAVLVDKADPDLKRWLPDVLWTALHPRVTTEMVSYVRYALKTVARRHRKRRAESFSKTPAIMTSALSRLRELPETFTFAAFCKYTHGIDIHGRSRTWFKTVHDSSRSR